MRVISLVPAASAWISRFEASDALLPIDPESPIDEQLARLRPDLIIVGDEGFAPAPPIATMTFAPKTFKDVLDLALALGSRLNRLSQAMHVIAHGEARLQALRQRIGITRDGQIDGAPPPSVLVLASSEPPMIAGQWVPDLVAFAGGRPVGADSGAPPMYLEEGGAVQADVLILTTSQDIAKKDVVAETLGPVIEQVGARQAWLVDRQFVMEPTPELHQGVEILAMALHGERAGDVAGANALLRLQTAPGP